MLHALFVEAIITTVFFSVLEHFFTTFFRCSWCCYEVKTCLVIVGLVFYGNLHLECRIPATSSFTFSLKLGSGDTY